MPPIANAALTFWRPAPGMSTTVSRAIDSRLFAPPPMRMSRIESARLGPEVDEPGSAVSAVRWSEPRTRTLLADVSG